MLAAFAGLPDGEGVWVINVGHGSPGGLGAGDDYIAYSEIDEILSQKVFRLDIFTGFTCYLGRSNISANQVVGAVGVVYGAGARETIMPGCVLGLGDNPWHMTADSLIRRLAALTGGDYREPESPAFPPDECPGCDDPPADQPPAEPGMPPDGWTPPQEPDSSPPYESPEFIGPGGDADGPEMGMPEDPMYEAPVLYDDPAWYNPAYWVDPIVDAWHATADFLSDAWSGMADFFGFGS